MTAAEVSPDAPTYWAAVITVVPVFALALVLEARRTAATWDLSARWLKLFLGLGYLYDGVALALIFTIALDRLAGDGDTSGAGFVNGLLLGVLVLLTVVPMADFVARGNPDVMLILRRVLPWSAWRQERRQAKKYLVELDQLVGQFESTIRRGERLIVETETIKERTQALSGAAARYAQQVVEKAHELDKERRESVLAATAEFQSVLASVQKPADSEEETRLSARAEMDRARQTLAEAKSSRDELRETVRGMKIGHFDEDLQVRLDVALRRSATGMARKRTRCRPNV